MTLKRAVDILFFTSFAVFDIPFLSFYLSKTKKSGRIK